MFVVNPSKQVKTKSTEQRLSTSSESNHEIKRLMSDQNFQPMMKVITNRNKVSPVGCSAAESPVIAGEDTISKVIMIVRRSSKDLGG